MPTDAEDAGAALDQIVRNLQDLIAALERRVPHIERVGEREIARDAAILKQKAQARLDELRQRNQWFGRAPRDQAGTDGR